ncbi:hypothetical protein Trydic_g19086 [Trypoxylus dichotomus]
MEKDNISAGSLCQQPRCRIRVNMAIHRDQYPETTTVTSESNRTYIHREPQQKKAKRNSYGRGKFALPAAPDSKVPNNTRTCGVPPPPFRIRYHRLLSHVFVHEISFHCITGRQIESRSNINMFTASSSGVDRKLNSKNGNDTVFALHGEIEKANGH